MNWDKMPTTKDLEKVISDDKLSGSSKNTILALKDALYGEISDETMILYTWGIPSLNHTKRLFLKISGYRQNSIRSTKINSQHELKDFLLILQKNDDTGRTPTK